MKTNPLVQEIKYQIRKCLKQYCKWKTKYKCMNIKEIYLLLVWKSSLTEYKYILAKNQKPILEIFYYFRLDKLKCWNSAQNGLHSMLKLGTNMKQVSNICKQQPGPSKQIGKQGQL